MEAKPRIKVGTKTGAKFLAILLVKMGAKMQVQKILNRNKNMSQI